MGRGKGHTPQWGRTHAGLEKGRGSARCFTKQPHLTDEIVIQGWASGTAATEFGRGKGRKLRAKGERPAQGTVYFLLPSVLPPPPRLCTVQEPWPSICPFLPPVQRPEGHPLCSELLAPPGILLLCNVLVGASLMAQW